MSEKPETKGEYSEASKCPKCGAALVHGYGMAGGGCGFYTLCDNDECDFFEKTQDVAEAE